MSEAPAELWVRPRTVRDPAGPVLPGQGWYQTLLRDEPEAVRYVRADLYEAALARLAVVRSWGEAPCLEPLPPDAGAHEQQPGEAMADALRALKEA